MSDWRREVSEAWERAGVRAAEEPTMAEAFRSLHDAWVALWVEVLISLRPVLEGLRYRLVSVHRFISRRAR